MTIKEPKISIAEDLEIKLYEGIPQERKEIAQISFNKWLALHKKLNRSLEDLKANLAALILLNARDRFSFLATSFERHRFEQLDHQVFKRALEVKKRDIAESDIVAAQRDLDEIAALQEHIEKYFPEYIIRSARGFSESKLDCFYVMSNKKTSSLRLYNYTKLNR